MTLPLILLSRPRADALAVAARLRSRTAAPILVGPVQEIVTVPAPPPAPGATLILTSRHAAAQVRRPGARAYCVGARTADAARAAGLTVVAVAADAEALAERILADRPEALVHLRGRHVTGTLGDRLRAAGLGLAEVEVYFQRACDLSASDRAALEAATAILAPVYSPRSARVLAEQWPAGAPPPVIVAISRAAAGAWSAPAARTVIAERADGAAVEAAVLAEVGSDSPC